MLEIYANNGPFVLKRLHIAVNQKSCDEEQLFARLSEYNAKQMVINEGLVIYPVADCQEISYTVLKCEPNCGILDNETLVFVDRCVKSLCRIQLLWVVPDDYFDKLMKTLFLMNDSSNITYIKSDYVTKLKNQNTVSGEGPFHISETMSINSKHEHRRTVSLNSNFDQPISILDQIDTPKSLINSIYRAKLEPFLRRNGAKIYFPGQIFYAGDLEFLVYAIYPPDKPGHITRDTEIYVSLDPWGEYQSVTIAPIRDTLPKIYDYDLHEDYLYPALNNKFKEAFRYGDSFNYLGVDFKITATYPYTSEFGCMRIGPNTQVTLGDPIDPTLADIIPSEDWNRIKMLSPRQQQIALHIAATQLDESAIQRITRTHSGQPKASYALINRLSASVERYKSPECGYDIFTKYGGSNLGYMFAEVVPDTKNICTICCQRFKNFDKFITLQCGHMFHWCCVRAWIRENLTCPNCRSLCG